MTVHHKELTTLQGILQNEAKLMVEWFEINAMQANPDKFQGMLLKGAKTVGDFAITVEGTEIAFVSEINALGVCIDDQLSFNAHVSTAYVQRLVVKLAPCNDWQVFSTTRVG